MKSPEQVLADWRGDAQTLRARGYTKDADLLDRCAEEISAAIKPFLAWYSETEAQLRSGRGRDYFRSRFGGLLQQGLAEMRGRQRYYRAAVVPQRVHASAGKVAGLRGDRSA